MHRRGTLCSYSGHCHDINRHPEITISLLSLIDCFLLPVATGQIFRFFNCAYMRQKSIFHTIMIRFKKYSSIENSFNVGSWTRSRQRCLPTSSMLCRRRFMVPIPASSATVMTSALQREHPFWLAMRNFMTTSRYLQIIGSG